jgi:hypothetical protein
MSTYTADVSRDGRFWLIHVPAIDRYTQARSLREIEDMTRDLIAVMQGVEPDSFEINVQLTMPASVREHLRRVEAARIAEAKARAEAAAELRAAAVDLHESGVALRDVGRLLGVSHQRASQLTSRGSKQRSRRDAADQGSSRSPRSA